MSVSIDYLGHSGFFAETESVMLLFDYFKGDLSFIGERPEEKPLFVFSSHAHADHFDPRIFSLRDVHRRTRYILSSDIMGDSRIPEGCNITYLGAGETCEIQSLGTVRTLLSTDEGVAFLVTTPEATLFHAGDLHWWDWPGEDPEWLREQETVFRREIGKLEGTPIDIAFLVLDDRIEDNYAEGMEMFVSLCRPRCALPMHFWNDRSVVSRFRELPCLNETGTVLLDTASETHWEV